MVFRFIDAEKGNFDVAVMCRVLGVSRSGYYAWARRPPSERTLANATLVEEIRRVHAESDGTYGSRRVHAELRRVGHEVNHKRIERLMRVEGIQGAYVPPKRRRSCDGVLGVDGVRVWPDLVKRDFQPTALTPFDGGQTRPDPRPPRPPAPASRRFSNHAVTTQHVAQQAVVVWRSPTAALVRG